MSSTNQRVSTQLLRATISRFEADRQEALAVIELYLNAAVGVGEHPNLVTELHAAVRNLSDAEESLETLQRNFLETPPEELNDEG